MDERPKVKEIVTCVIGMAGAVLVCCEADELLEQAVVSGIGFALWGVAYLVWKLWSRWEDAKL